MDIDSIARVRAESAMSAYAARVGAANSAVSDRLSSLQSPQDRFAQMLGAVTQASEDAIRYTRMTPENLAIMRGVPTDRATLSRAPVLSSSMAEKRAQYDPLVQQSAQRYGLPSDLIHAVIQAESSYNPGSVSSVGAQGLMQLMPGTAAGLGVTNSFDPAQNIDGGSRYLRQMLDRFGGDLRLALAAYNCGPARVESLGIATSGDAAAYTRLSDGVRSYVSRVLSYAGIA